MRLFICEKPSAAQNLAQALGGGRTVRNSEGRSGQHIAGKGWLIAALSGHYFRLSMPEDHDPALARWSLSTLPIIIDNHHWILIDKNTGRMSPEQIKDQTDHIVSLYPRVNEVCIATDSGQEGQLIGQVFVQNTGWTGNTTRLWAGAQEPSALREAVANIKQNHEYQGQYECALARTIADQKIGINFTRLYRKIAEMSGYNTRWSIGRVRNAVLGIVYEVCKAHDNHVAQTYFTAELSFGESESVVTTTLDLPSRLLDDQSQRCIDKASLSRYIAPISEPCEFTVASVTNKIDSKAPPLPFSINTLCQFMVTSHNLMPDYILNTVGQGLYDKGFITYIRSEENVYETSILDDIDVIGSAAAKLSPELAFAVSLIDKSKAEPVFDSSRVVEHTAISITKKTPDFSTFNDDEKALYTAVAMRLFAQLTGHLEKASSTVKLTRGEYTASLKSNSIKAAGWTAILPYEDKTAILPHLDKGDTLLLSSAEIEEKLTKAPPRLTVAGFLDTLKDCTRFLSPDVKERVKVGRLGTAATQPNYLADMIKGGTLQLTGKKTNPYVVITKQGQSVINISPKYLNSPDMTSIWELQFAQIRNRKLSKDAFLQEVNNFVIKQVDAGKTTRFKPSPIMEPCPSCECALLRLENKKFQSFFYACSNEHCDFTTPDHDGKPMQLLDGDGEPCKNCDGKMVTKLRRKQLASYKPRYQAPKDRRYLICSEKCNAKDKSLKKSI
ncbi:MAG: DNA topoisomerase-3 [Oleiphilaceae bacterium]|jgi:DNA topoisomerase-3